MGNASFSVPDPRGAARHEAEGGTRAGANGATAGAASLPFPHPTKKETAMSQLTDLRDSGLKATLPRLRILELFQTRPERHFAAEDIYRLLLDSRSDVGLATVYRVLSQLETAGLLRRSSFIRDKAVYELNDNQHHDHLICTDCGRVEEFHDDQIEQRQESIAQERGFRLQEHALALYAACTKPHCEHRPAGRAALR